MRGQLPKAYLRVDPNIDAHPDPGTIVLLMVWANRQSRRGRFKSLTVVEKIIGRKKVAAAIERGDLVQQEDGAFYLEGWDTWQEGDFDVASRMRKLREKRRNDVTNRPVTLPSPPSEASGVRRQASDSEQTALPASAGATPAIADGPTREGAIRAMKRAGNDLTERAEKRHTWLTPFGEAWIARWGIGSQPPYEELAGALGRCHKGQRNSAREEIGDDAELLARWGRFLLAARTSQMARPERFVQGLGEWAERPAAVPARASPSSRPTVGDRAMAAAAEFLKQGEG
jgi:hypothetical protein